MRESINVGTLGGYKSACKSYFNWCEVRAITPWPVDEILLAAFCVHMGTSLTVASIRGYACAIKFIQLQLSPYEWTCDSSVVVRQALRWLKKRYGEAGKAAKYPITLAVLRAILPLLPGWPVAADMSHDDRLFTCASLIGTSAFLRGGEFLTYSDSAHSVVPFVCTPTRKALCRSLSPSLHPRMLGGWTRSTRTASPQPRVTVPRWLRVC